MIEVNDEFSDKVVDHVYSDYCVVCLVYNSNHERIAEFPRSTARDVPWNEEFIKENGWCIVETSDKVREYGSFTAITDGFWTCDCKNSFVRHVGEGRCSECGIHVTESRKRLPVLDLRIDTMWDNISDIIH